MKKHQSKYIHGPDALGLRWGSMIIYTCLTLIVKEAFGTLVLCGGNHSSHKYIANGQQQDHQQSYLSL